MIEGGQDLRFTLESGKPLGVGRKQIGQNFQRDVTAKLQVARFVDFAHAADAEERDDFVGAETSARRNSHVGWRATRRLYAGRLAAADGKLCDAAAKTGRLAWGSRGTDDANIVVPVAARKSTVTFLTTELGEFRAEYRDFHGEMYRFRDEMYAFRSEMYSFRDEMYAFRSEMYGFRDEMYAFRDETRAEFVALRREIREGDEETRRQMRILIEDLRDDMRIFMDAHLSLEKRVRRLEDRQ